MCVGRTFGWAACAVLAALACGCSANQTIMRGQSPIVDSHATPASYGHAFPIHETVQDQLYHQSTSHYVANTYPGEMGATVCPSGSCPYGGAWGHSGAYGWGCPADGQQGGDFMPKHHFSYSYSQPNDLTYPAPNQPAGAVVYPYYTHKGPSDFFRK